MTVEELLSEPRPINDYWREFEKMIGLNKGPEIQRREMKRAFFAGFDIAQRAITNVSCQLPEAEACKQLSSWSRQADGFAVAVQEGGA